MTPSEDADQFIHGFALETIDAVRSYIALLSDAVELVEGPDSDGSRRRVLSLAAVAMQWVGRMSRLVVSLLELDEDHLDNNENAASIANLAQAVVAAMGVLMATETLADLRDCVLLSPDTIARFLAADGTEVTLAAHFLRQTGRELGDWPGWEPLPTPRISGAETP